MKKMLIVSVLILFSIFIFHGPLLAADLDISCDTGGCSPTVAPGFFSSSEVWYPGKSATRIVKVTNSSGFIRETKSRAQNTSSTGNIDSVMDMLVSNNKSGNIIWQGTLNSYYSLGNILLGDIPDGGEGEYSFKVTMQSGAGNQYQGKATSFDMVLSFNQSPNNPTSTPSPTLPSSSATPTQAPDVTSDSVPTDIPTSNPTDHAAATNTPVPNPTDTPVPGPTNTPGSGPTNTPGPSSTPVPTIPNPFGGIIFPAIGEGLALLNTDVSGLVTGTPTPTPASAVLGTGTTSIICLDGKLWLMVLGLQMLLSSLFLKMCDRKNCSAMMIGHLLVTLASIIISMKFFCTEWMVIVAGIIGIAGVVLSYRMSDFGFTGKKDYLHINLIISA
jgi:hypothetical protein